MVAGRGRGDETPFVRGYRENDYTITLPRGLTDQVVAKLRVAGYRPRVADRRTEVGVVLVGRGWGQGELREMQRQALQVCLDAALGPERRMTGGGRVRMPTGVGKTRTALQLIVILAQRALVVVPDTGLMKQWAEEAAEFLAVPVSRIGVVGGGQLRLGDLTVAVRDSLRDPARLAALGRAGLGCVVLDEAQGGATRTVYDALDALPARFRFGFSADERRQDGMDFFTEWLLGDVLYDGDRDDATEQGYIVPVTMRVVPTEFRAPWYSGGFGADWNRLLEEACAHPERNAVLDEVIADTYGRGRDLPVVVFTHRREYTRSIADRYGVPCLRGGEKDFEASKEAMNQGRADMAAATFHAFGVGQNVRRLRTGICATPLGKDADKFFNQVRGRFVRLSPDKERGYLYYLWDQHVFPDMAQRLWHWNRGDVELCRDGQWHRAGIDELVVRTRTWGRR
jgi:superfamily II DNA or RNA helicase